MPAGLSEAPGLFGTAAKARWKPTRDPLRAGTRRAPPRGGSGEVSATGSALGGLRARAGAQHSPPRGRLSLPVVPVPAPLTSSRGAGAGARAGRAPGPRPFCGGGTAPRPPPGPPPAQPQPCPSSGCLRPAGCEGLLCSTCIYSCVLAYIRVL